MIDGGPGANLTGQWRTGSSHERTELIAKIRFAVLLASSSVSGRVLALPPWMMYGSTPSRSCLRHGRLTASAFSWAGHASSKISI